MAATLGLALSRVADEEPTAVGLVRLLAFLAPEPVLLALLLADEPLQACWALRWQPRWGPCR